MPCYTPLTLYKSLKGVDPKSGKTPLRGIKNGGNPQQPVKVPCQRCIGCRLERSRQWAIRCINEAQMHEKNCFVTLTYETENLTYGGEAYTLYPRDLQLFFKKLRKKYGPKIKYFACGEYGEKKGRPHYHACIFGVDFDDKILTPVQKGEFPLYTSASLAKLWTHGGNVIGEVNFETAAYTARYILKKKLGKTASHYKKVGIEPEFTRMSRRPGLGASWLAKYKGDVFPHDYQVIRGGVKTRPPKYYGSLYEVENPEQFAAIKIRREKQALKMAEDNTKIRLAAKLAIKKQQIKTLLRSLE